MQTRRVLYGVVALIVVLYAAFSVYQLIEESKQLELESKRLQESIKKQTNDLEGELASLKEEAKILALNLSSLAVGKDATFVQDRVLERESMMCSSIPNSSVVNASSVFMNYEDKQIRMFEEFDIVNATRGLIGPTWGASWGDYDGDIYPDLMLSNHYQSTALYMNFRGQRFIDVTLSALGPIAGQASRSACWGDFNGDYWDDILEPAGLKYGYPLDNNFWTHQSDFSRERLYEEASAYRLEHSTVDTSYCFWWDSDMDGDLDLFERGIVNNKSVITFNRQIGNHVFFSDGPSLFPDGLHDADFIQYTYVLARSICFIAISKKGRFQIFDANTVPYKNITAEFPDLQFELKHKTIVDVAFVDLNNDKHIDIIIATDMGHPIIFYNRGARKFTGGAIALNETSSTVGITALAVADFNNDMLPDIYVVRSSYITNEPNILYINQGNKKFVEYKWGGGAGGSALGTGDSVAVADFDVDGSLDLLVTNGAGPPPFGIGPTQLFRNTNSFKNNWIEVDLLGVLDNPNGIGTIVEVTAGGVVQTRVVGNNVHTAKSTNHRRLHFGLGNATVVSTISVWWNKRHFVQEYNGVAVNQLVTIFQLFNPYIPERVYQIAKARGTIKMECEAGKKRMKPYFLILGIWKAGTTSLSGTLVKHPQIKFPVAKETFYFTTLYKELGIDFYWSLFPCGTENEITFEATAGYLYQEGLPQRLKPHVPNAKFIIMLRDPVERAYSHFYMHFRARVKDVTVHIPDYFDVQMREHITGFNNCTRRNTTELCANDSTWTFLNAGLYYYSITRWYSHFPKENFLVLSFSEFIQANNTEVMNRVLNFLNVTVMELPQEVINVASKKLNMLPSTRTMLYDFYKPYNLKLYDLLNKDFGWNLS